MEDKKSKLKELALEMLSPEPRGTVHENQFCIKPPVHFPDTYIEEFSFDKIPFLTSQREERQLTAKFSVTICGTITKQFDSDKLILKANVYEICTLNFPEAPDIPDYVLYEFTLRSENDYTCVNIVLYEYLSIPDHIASDFKIPAIEPLQEGQPRYSIRFHQFSHFENVEIISTKPPEMKMKEGKKPPIPHPDFTNQSHFIADIFINSQNKPLKINNLSTWLRDDHDPANDLKIWLFTHYLGRILTPPPIKTERFFLHGHNIKFGKMQLNGISIETVLFSSSIAFLTQNRNDPDIQEILSSIKLKFDEEKLEILLKKDMKERIGFFKQYMSKEDNEFDPQQLNPKIIQEHINVYEYLLNDPHQAHQRDEIHRYIAYFRSRLSRPKKIIFWLTGDYFKIATPLFCALGLYALYMGMLQSIPYFKNTIPFYEIFNFKPETTHFWETVLITLCKSMPNIIRWAIEAGITYCLFAAGAAIKKNNLAWAIQKTFSLRILHKNTKSRGALKLLCLQ